MIDSCENCQSNTMKKDINGIPGPFCEELEDFIDVELYYKAVGVELFIDERCPLSETND